MFDATPPRFSIERGENGTTTEASNFTFRLDGR